jgi:hypothetical protein
MTSKATVSHIIIAKFLNNHSDNYIRTFFDVHRAVHRDIQDVPLAVEPGISLIILPLMRILQRNLKRTYLIA